MYAQIFNTRNFIRIATFQLELKKYVNRMQNWEKSSFVTAKPGSSQDHLCHLFFKAKLIATLGKFYWLQRWTFSFLLKARVYENRLIGGTVISGRKLNILRKPGISVTNHFFSPMMFNIASNFFFSHLFSKCYIIMQWTFAHHLSLKDIF